MRLNSSPTTWLLPLLLLTATPITAMNNAILRKLNDLAEQGLDADGNALQSSSSSEEMTLFSTPSKTFVQEPPIPSEYVKLPLNHFSKSKDWGYDGVFYNRFWVRESAYKRGGPVFVYDVGEADASGNAQFRLTGEGSFFRELVDEFGGVGVVWEHRFCEF